MATVLVFKSCFVCFHFITKFTQIHAEKKLKIKMPIKLLDLNLFTSLAYDYSSQAYNLFTYICTKLTSWVVWLYLLINLCIN